MFYSIYAVEDKKPYKKPNVKPTYISVNSNHPPNIIKALSDSISKRINNISFDKEIFHNAAPYYNNVLSASGYKENLFIKKICHLQME